MMFDVCWLLLCPLKILKFWGKNILLELLFQNETVTLKMKPIITYTYKSFRSCIGWRGERRWWFRGAHRILKRGRMVAMNEIVQRLWWGPRRVNIGWWSGQVRSAQGSQTSRATKMEARQDTVASSYPIKIIWGWARSVGLSCTVL